MSDLVWRLGIQVGEMCYVRKKKKLLVRRTLLIFIG
jgi:hypothetical protein